MLNSSSNGLISIDDLNFWRKIRKIQFGLGLSDEGLASLMSISKEDYIQSKQSYLPLSLDSLMKLCDRLHLSLGHFLNDSIDYSLVSKNYFGREVFISEKYTKHAFGNLKTFSAIIKYLNVTRGESFSQSILDKFQIAPSLIFEPTRKVNIQFYEDLTLKLAQMGVAQDEFRRIGYFASYENSSNVSLINKLQQYYNLSDFEKSLNIMVDILDHNHNYKIQWLKNDEALITATPTQELQNVFSKKILGNIHTSVIKEGAIPAITSIIGLNSKLKVGLVRSIHQGDATCSYLISRKF